MNTKKFCNISPRPDAAAGNQTTFIYNGAHTSRRWNSRAMTDQPQNERLRRLLSYLEQDNRNPTLLADIAALQFAGDHREQARQFARDALAIDDKQIQAHAVLGLLAMRDGDYAAAADALGKAIALGDDAPAVFYHHAQALVQLGRFADAEKSAAAAAQFFSVYPHAPALYVRVLHYLGKIEEAIAYAEQLNSAGVAAPRLHGMLATLYMDAEDSEKARQSARKALTENPDDSDARTVLGLLALGDLDSRQAQAEFERVLRAQATHGRAMLGSGLGHMLNGDLAAATHMLEQATQSTNMREHLGTWQTLAWCHILQKNSEEAERVLRHALELDRNFAETHGGLAVVALMRGNLDSAVQSARRAAGLDPNNFSGNFAQSLIQQVSGNPVQARAIVEQLLTQPILPGGKTVQMAVAEMLAKNEAGAPRGSTLH